MSERIKQLLTLAICLLLTAFAGGGLGYALGQKAGFKDGMKTYHQICYQISGPMLDKEDGTVVYCMPLATIPEEEMNKHRQQELDNKNKVWYNNT